MLVMEQESCCFPLFREAFIDRASWSTGADADSMPSTSEAAHPFPPSVQGAKGDYLLVTSSLRSIGSPHRRRDTQAEAEEDVTSQES